MRRRPPFTLWWYVSVEMWKLVLLTAAVLVTVIAFAAAVKPLADGKVGPEDAVKLMLLAMVPMLQYALPFAACFGATMAYHRLSSDNELTAAYAGGVSHRAVLAPAVVSGVVLAGVLLTLSNAVIPRFLRAMAEIVAQDAAKWVETAVQRGEALEMPGQNTYLYADKVFRAERKDGGDFDGLRLLGVLVVQLDKTGRVESQVSARSADVWFRRVSGVRAGAAGGGVSAEAVEAADPGDEGGAGEGKAATEVTIRTVDAVGKWPLVRGQQGESVMRFYVPNAFSDNVKFKSFSELRRLRERPEIIDKVDKSRRLLASAVEEREVVAGIAEDLRLKGRAEFEDAYRQERIVLRGSGLRTTRRGDGKREPRVLEVLPEKGGAVIVEKARGTRERAPGGREETVWRTVQQQRAASAVVRLSAPADAPGARVTLQMLNVATTRLGSEGELQTPPAPEELSVEAAAGELEKRSLSDLRYVGATGGRETLEATTPELLSKAAARAAAKPADGPVLEGPVKDLRKRVRDLMNEVLSKEHERYAMSVACLVMVVVGAVMAMRLRGALPLTVYLWAFFPALATTLAVSGGQQLTHSNGLLGLPVLWAGVAALGGFAVVEFVRLARH
jgi:lipopolysaccharide export LptBFGC system permease protein LptF